MTLSDPWPCCKMDSISNSYIIGCPPVRGDNPRVLASGLSNIQSYKHGITIYTTYINVDLAHHEVFRAKVGKGGIKWCKVGVKLKG